MEGPSPANAIHWTNVSLMLAQRRNIGLITRVCCMGSMCLMALMA